MSGVSKKFEREPLTLGREFALMVFPRLRPGDLVIEGPPKTYDEIIKSPEFRETAVKILKDFAVSGIWNREKKILQKRTDLDGKASQGLLELAGFDVSQTKYVRPGDTALGFFNIDTGCVHGIAVEGDIFKDKMGEITGWCDNHGQKSKQGSSSAEFMYQALAELGFIEKNEVLDRLVDFTNRMEAGDIDWEKEFWRSDRTLIGLARFMNFKMLFDYFSAGFKYKDEVPEEFLKKWSTSKDFLPKNFLERKTILEGKQGWQEMTEKQRKEELKKNGLYTIEDRVEEQEQIIKKSGEQLEELKQDGFILETNYGKVIITTKYRNLVGGYSAAYGYGANGYLVWCPENNNFIFSIKRGEIEANLGQGVRVRKHIWIKPEYDGEEIRISLERILKLIGFKEKPSLKLKEIFERDYRRERQKNLAARHKTWTKIK